VPCHPDILGNYAYINDVVDGHRLAMEKGTTGERYILGGENISFRRFIEIIRKNGNRRKLYCPLPDPVLKAWSFLEVVRGRFLNRDPLVTPGILKRLQRNKIMDSSKAVRQLGYAITPFESGLQHTIDHFKKAIL
jgi:nucleoside-diphosphate-sugar epimerase